MNQPKIASHAWGRIDVAHLGGVLSFKDVRLSPDGAREWDWNEFGTRHRPGVGVEEVEELLKHELDAIVLSRGVDLQLLVPEATVRWLHDRGIAVYVLQTDEAVARYNALIEEGARVGALIHSTC